jgi:hypothetical protein
MNVSFKHLALLNFDLPLLSCAGLIDESSNHLTLWQQVADHPVRVLAVFAAIGVATVIPVLRYASTVLRRPRGGGAVHNASCLKQQFKAAGSSSRVATTTPKAKEACQASKAWIFLADSHCHDDFMGHNFRHTDNCCCCCCCRGYTRKEGFANLFGGLPWIPLAENWNGRVAMLGFAGMLLQETVLHMNTLQAWGLQSLL